MTAALTYPPRTLGPEQEAMRAEVRAFLQKDYADGGFGRGQEAMARYDVEFSRRWGQAGFIGITWPKKYGGRGLTFLDRYVVTEEALAAGAPVGAHWVADRQSGPLLLKYGTEEQRQRFLPRIVAGEAFFCIGMSEPDSGSDLASVRMSATRTDGGWLLNGTKLWTSLAHICHYMIALVRTSPVNPENRHEGMSQMIVDLNAPGVEVRPVYNLAGEHHFNQEVFTDYFLPDENVVGEIGAGWEQVMSELAYERSGPERILSTFQTLVELVRQVGDNPSEVEARAIGRLTAHLMTLRGMSVSVAGMLADGKMPVTEAALVKDLGTNYCKDVPETARLICPPEDGAGGNSRYEKMLKTATLLAPSLTIQGGTREILRGMIARGLGLR
ncbi:acyl-CoA dehydrogenase family protein [Emcibacter sp. SYSU 3D8]|uniref:acyl-CoA dehydrogenase family protein n=1 Tax=Emcibacter sp. SYSU 3D8 TaxID=3133969 RepID=UPI0031FF1EC7